MTTEETQADVTAEVARSSVIAGRVWLPEQLATEAVKRFPDDLDAAKTFAKQLATVGQRESNWNWNLLRADGCGEDGHGWDELQIDDRSHPAEVARIRALEPRSLGRRSLVIQVGAGILLDAFAEYAGNFEAGFCRYNCGKAGVDAGLVNGDPNMHTTGHDYGRWCVAFMSRNWPTPTIS